ncbi:RNA-directed DNA polymerase, eukaryota, reverse transcriptase zinc-binding domain protein [Tanacetum coccineum]
MLFKVDFEKAIDSVSWIYLDYVLDKLGFRIRWRIWIKAGLMSARTSILVNGSPTSEFSLRRGLRQGDTLSPFLFIMEGLHMDLNKNLAANMFHGVTIGSSGIHLSHLFYADDVIILSELHVRCEPGSFPFPYLGLPIGLNMSRILNWQVLVDHFKARMSGWKANLLSTGGRLTLIKSVLESLGIYYLSIFKVPEIVVKSLESLRVAFFWVGHEHTKKIAWVKSSNTLASLHKGGFGAGCLKAFNKALMLK